MSLDYNLEESIIKTYRGWDSFEKRNSNSSIIDLIFRYHYYTLIQFPCNV